MKEPEKFLKGCAQAQVDHLHTVLDGPIEPGGKLNGAPAHVPSQHAHAVDLRFGREGVDDACAGGPMSGDVGWFVIQLDAVLVFCSGIVLNDHPPAHRATQCRMIILNPTVYNCYANPFAGAT